MGQFSHCNTKIAILFGAPLVSGSVINSDLGKKLDDLKKYLKACGSFQLTKRSYYFVLRAVHQSSSTSCVHPIVLVIHNYCLTFIITSIRLTL